MTIRKQYSYRNIIQNICSKCYHIAKDDCKKDFTHQNKDIISIVININNINVKLMCYKIDG